MKMKTTDVDFEDDTEDLKEIYNELKGMRNHCPLNRFAPGKTSKSSFNPKR